MKSHQIRIVGGTYRHTPIPVATGSHLRPTPDRVRETLFNWLDHFWARSYADKRVLDLFAGSGALGFEAASRGAGEVVMVEQAGVALKGLHQVRQRLHCTTVHIHAGDARRYLQSLPDARFDLILLDPPFGENWMPRLWPALGRVLVAGGLLYVESEHACEAPTPDWQLLRHGRAGKVRYHLLQFAAAQKNGNNAGTTSDTAVVNLAETA